MRLIKVIITFSVILSFSSIATSAQVEGIGDFIIGMSSDDFLNLPSIRDRQIVDGGTGELDARMKCIRSQPLGKLSDCTKNLTPVADRSAAIKKITVDSEFSGGRKQVYSKDVVDYSLRENLGIVSDKTAEQNYDIRLRFYKDKLVSMRVGYATYFEDILRQKYGNPTIEDKTKSVICQNKMGAKVNRMDGYRALIWDGPRDVEAVLMEVFMDCGSLGTSYTVKDKKMEALVKEIENREKALYESNRVKEISESSKL